MSNEAEQIKKELAELSGEPKPQSATEPDGFERYTSEEISAHNQYVQYCRSCQTDPGTLKGTADIVRGFKELGVL